MWRSVLSLYISCISVFGTVEDDEITYMYLFRVEPGGQLLHYEKTKMWSMMISLSDEGEYSCTVETLRSFLDFETFELKVTGAIPIEGHAFGQINRLNPDEYSFDFESKNVGTIKEVDGIFRSRLQKLCIKALKAI